MYFCNFFLGVVGFKKYVLGYVYLYRDSSAKGLTRRPYRTQ